MRIAVPRRRRASALALTLSVTLLLSGCGSSAPSAPSATQGDGRGCITAFDPNTDYFPTKSTISDATNFSIRYEKSYQVITVAQPYPGGAPESYVLVRCGAPDPQLTGDLAAAQRITVPVSSLYSASTTHLPSLAALDSNDVLRGVASASAITDPDLKARIADARITEYAPGDTVDIEKVVTANPSVLVTAGVDDPSYAKLRAARIPVVADAEYLEPTALGRAEWVKLFAALTGTEDRAATLYDTIRRSYGETVAKVASAPKAPVLPGTMYQGTWYMAPGGGYFGRLIRDAGATYPWESDTSTASLQLSFEDVYARAGTSPIWLVMADWARTADAVAEDPRYGTLSALTTGQVWSSTAAAGTTAQNDFFQLGVLRPDLVLGDLAAIVHPDLFPQHTFAFYRRLPQA